jgi:hypothetical protein
MESNKQKATDKKATKDNFQDSLSPQTPAVQRNDEKKKRANVASRSDEDPDITLPEDSLVTPMTFKRTKGICGKRV